MPPALDVLAHRLRNQGLARTTFRRPEEVVSALGAVQSQDYPGAKWALGMRLGGAAASDAAIEDAFTEGRILRTHVMRPTWHFVAPADIRWMLALTAPRVRQVMAYYDRQLGLTPQIFSRSRAVFERVLRGGKHLTRAELAAALSKAGMSHKGQSLGHVVLRAELDAVICSGPRRGKQFTYALLEERVPPAPARTRDEALAALTQRYFTSHGPATVRDYAWWSGLTVRDAKAGIEMVKPALVQEVVGDLTYWLVPAKTPKRPASPSVHLLPNYDEFGIAYKDRGALVDGAPRSFDGMAATFAHLLVIDGTLRGMWRRDITTRTAGVELQPFAPLTKAETRAVAGEVERYGAFLDLPASLL